MSQRPSKPVHTGLSVAVTGSAGSGKSFVCRRLAALGAHLIDADQVAREVVLPGTEGLAKVAAHFGSSVLTRAGQLDRAALRRRIVSDARDRRALEAILHPEIIAGMEARVLVAFRAGHRLVVSEVPLLFELNLASRFDRVVLVKARRDLKIGRLVARDHVPASEAGKLLDLQMPDEKKEKLSDIVIENNGSTVDLAKSVDRLHGVLYTDTYGQS